jgi:hypothetical protein
MDRTDKLLMLMWIVGGGLLFVAFVLLTLFTPLFGDQARDAWQWLITYLLPPIGLVVGVRYEQKQGTGSTPLPSATVVNGKVSAPLVVVSVNALYLFLLATSIVAALVKNAPVATLQESSLWLGPMLAFAIATLGTRFARA